MMRKWTGKIIYSDGTGWDKARFFETEAGSIGQASKNLLDRYWKTFSQSDKIRYHKISLVLTKGDKVGKRRREEPLQTLELG